MDDGGPHPAWLPRPGRRPRLRRPVPWGSAPGPVVGELQSSLEFSGSLSHLPITGVPTVCFEDGAVSLPAADILVEGHV